MAGRVGTVAGLSLLALAGAARSADPPASPRPSEPAPSAELLLYLAEFQDAAGDAVDPLAFAEQPESQDKTGKAPAEPSPATPKQKQDARDEHDHKPAH